MWKHWHGGRSHVSTQKNSQKMINSHRLLDNTRTACKKRRFNLLEERVITELHGLQPASYYTTRKSQRKRRQPPKLLLVLSVLARGHGNVATSYGDMEWGREIETRMECKPDGALLRTWADVGWECGFGLGTALISAVLLGLEARLR